MVSLFAGGCVTGWMSDVTGRTSGFMNGILFGSFTLVVFSAFAFGPRMFMIEPTSTGAANSLQAAAWWAFFGVVLGLGAAGAGGAFGARMAMEPASSPSTQRNRASVM